MTTPSRIEQILLELLQIGSPAARAAFLSQVCHGDAALRERLERLLEARQPLSARPGQGSQPTAIDLSRGGVSRGDATTAFAVDLVSSQVGPYRLIQKLGEGGMGTVYVAEQDRPVKRHVALKLVTVGLDSDLVMRHFQAERQVLALMDHPNIARFFDAGTTESGEPYFAMELIKGAPITRFCDDLRLPVRERLELFVQVCQAIQHAHLKGVIHRDIKPSNVLVRVEDDRPVAKVIDFGVAKALHSSPVGCITAGHDGVWVGTVAYMAPEQADQAALDVDTRADVYSSGVLLYELLTGTTPLERHRVPRPTASEIGPPIRGEEVPKPSELLGTSPVPLRRVAAERQTSATRLVSQVRGELDCITMRALERDRTRRYQSAGALAADVLRHLRDEPVEACPPSALYRARKHLRRHRAAVTGAALCLLLLVGGTALSAWLAVRASTAEGSALAARDAETRQREWAERERDRAQAAETSAKSESERAQRSAAEAQAVISYIQEQVLLAARASQEGGLAKSAAIQKAIAAADKMAAEFAGQQVAEASVRAMLGETYRYLGEPARAVPQLERAVQLRAANLGPDHSDTLNAQNELALCYRELGDWDKTISLLERTLQAKRRARGTDHVETLDTQRALAVAYRTSGRLDQAISLYEQTLALQRARLGPGHPDTLATQNCLAVAYRQADRLPEAIALLEQAVPGLRAKLGPDHPNTLNSQHNLAVAYLNSGRVASAIQMLEQTRSALEHGLGPNHPETLHSQNQLAKAYLDGGRLEQSISLFERTLTARRAKLGTNHPDTLCTMYGLALAYARTSDSSRAEPLFREALELRKIRLGPRHRDVAVTLEDFGRFLVDHQRYPEAEQRLRECLVVCEQSFPGDWLRFDAQSLLGAALLGQMKCTQAEPALLQGYAGLKARRMAIPPLLRTRLGDAARRLVRFYDATGNTEEADHWRKELCTLVPDPGLAMSR